ARVSPSTTGGDSRVGLEALLGGDPYRSRLDRSGRAMPHRPRTVLVELADFRPRFTWQCPRSFFRVAPPNVRVQPPSGFAARSTVQSNLDNKTSLEFGARLAWSGASRGWAAPVAVFALLLPMAPPVWVKVNGMSQIRPPA
ncbi:MAG TPA: hypothetical protein PLH19_15115, partial [Anaerolineae bacterium]|nr:hypothetical protein [Anaerolineae bacterium]